jgi:SAM-dependent methyltransferase
MGEDICHGQADQPGCSMKLMYDLWYRYGTPPWVIGPRSELVQLVESQRIVPCRAIDLGCGTGDNAIFLAQSGFSVTGVDFSKEAIATARDKAVAANVSVDFHVDDLTCLSYDYGTFDLLVDYGTLDDLNLANRDQYLASILPLTRPCSLFLLWCHEWRHRWWERAMFWVVPFESVALPPGEARQRFGHDFEIECIVRNTGGPLWEPSSAAYLMTRRSGASSMGRERE